MHQRRPRRREEEEPPPAAAEFGRHPAQEHYKYLARQDIPTGRGKLQTRKQSNALRTTTDSTTYINGFSAEEDCIALDIGQSFPKTADEISIKELIEEEVSKVKERRHSSPGLIARLMGLDTFPSLVRQEKLQEKNVDGCSQIAMSTDLPRKYVQTEDRPRWSKNEKEDFKDVFEITKASKSRKHNNRSEMREMLRFREHEKDINTARQNFMDMKYFSHGDVLQSPKDVNGAFRVKSSAKDLFLELLEDHNSLFAKHLQDLNQEPYSPQRSKITILKPCKGTRHSSNKVQQRSPKAERNHDKRSHAQQKATGSFKTLARRFRESYAEENTGSLSQSSLASLPYACRHETSVQPSHIVILKPSLSKTQKATETNLVNSNKFWFGSKKDILESTIQDFCKEGRSKLNLSHHTEVLKHNVNGSKEIAREIRRKMRHNLRSLKKRNFMMEMDKYNGNGDSFTMPGIAQKLIHPDAISLFPDSFYEWSNSFSPLSSHSTVSLLGSETQSLSSERENIIHQVENVGLISGCSSPHEQMPPPTERETLSSTVHMLNVKNASAENLASNEVLSSKASHLGIYRMDALRDGSSRLSLRSNSPPASSSPELGDGKRHDGCYMLKDIPEIGPSVSSGAKLSMAMPRLKISEHHNHRSQLADLVEEDNLLPEREIHANSDGLRKNIHLKGFSASTKLHPATNGNKLTSTALISVLQDEVQHFTTREEHMTQSGLAFPSDNLFIQENFNDGIQEKLLLSESDTSMPQSVRSKDLEHSSPVSVLETPPEDEAYSSGCFERLSADLKELRIQLERLKQQSASTHLEENEILMLNDTDNAGKDCMLLPSVELHQGFIDDEDRDFTYLLDALLESGIHSSDDGKLVNACYLLGSSPLDQSVFSKLEKRYDAIASWSRSERKLLFDHINCSLVDLVRSWMDVRSRTTPSLGVQRQDRDCFTEDLWKMVMKQRKELQCNENKILEPKWFVGENNDTDDSIRIEIEKMLSADLLEELVSEFILA